MRKENGMMPPPLRCINKKKDVWAIVWNGEPCADSENSDYMEALFDHKPTPKEVHDTIESYYNAETDDKITNGYEWQGNKVYLSMENQINFKAAYDLCVQFGSVIGGELKFKLSEDENGVPIYHTFTKLEDMTQFYSGAVKHINACLNAGWSKKDVVDWSVYDMEEGA